MKNKVIKVTEADIRAGIRGNFSRCPVALAAQRVFKKKRVRVGCTGTIYVGAKGKRWRGCFNRIARFIKKYDRGSVVQPTIFEIVSVSEIGKQL